jgi:hypothetical protein
MVFALAGRRVDEPNAQTARFPLASVDRVRERLRDTFAGRGATALVSSAACGADLLALDEAGTLGLRRRIVLPYERARFRRTSVTDRPGRWGALFDRILDEVGAQGDLVTIAHESMGDDAAFAAASDAILRGAVRLAAERHEPAGAIVVWEGRSRGIDDLTDAFRSGAVERGLSVVEILTR